MLPSQKNPYQESAMFHHRRITPAAYLAHAGILALVAANAKRATTALDIRAECDRGRDASMTAYDYNNLRRAPLGLFGW